jgi:polar amino acid transport system substrate-binding protein
MRGVPGAMNVGEKNAMKRMLRAIVALLLTVALAAPAGAGDVLTRVMASKKLINALDVEYPPFSFLNTSNQMDGFDVDVAKEVAQRLGVALEQVTPGWDVITGGKWAGRWDISIGSMTATNERATMLDFPVQYYYGEAVLLVNKDNTSVKEAKDLSGKKIGVQVSTTYEKYLQKNLQIDAAGAPPVTYRIDNAQIVFYDEEPQGIADLVLGDGARLDGMIVGILTAQEYIKNGKPVRIVGEPLFYEPISIAVDKGDPEFAAKVKEIIEAMRADGTLKKLSEQRLGVDVTTPPGG